MREPGVGGLHNLEQVLRCSADLFELATCEPRHVAPCLGVIHPWLCGARAPRFSSEFS